MEDPPQEDPPIEDDPPTDEPDIPEVEESPIPPGADPYIDRVVSFEPGGGTSCNDDCPIENVFGPPHGGGTGGGSFDIISLGRGGEMIIEMIDYLIFDGEGADFIVFENPFAAGEETFAEPAQISVSEDGETFVPFSCTLDDWPYAGCAGVMPVFANPDENSIDPTDPETAGGDSFDLADVGLSVVRFIKLEDKTTEINCPVCTSGFDLDAIAIVHGTTP